MQNAMLRDEVPQRYSTVPEIMEMLEGVSLLAGTVVVPIDGGFELYGEVSENLPYLEQAVVGAQLDVSPQAFILSPDLKGPFADEQTLRQWLLKPGQAAVVSDDGGIYAYGDILNFGDKRLERILSKMKARFRNAKILPV